MGNTRNTTVLFMCCSDQALWSPSIGQKLKYWLLICSCLLLVLNMWGYKLQHLAQALMFFLRTLISLLSLLVQRFVFNIYWHLSPIILVYNTMLFYLNSLLNAWVSIFLLFVFLHKVGCIFKKRMKMHLKKFGVHSLLNL